MRGGGEHTMNEQHSSAQREKPSASAWQIHTHQAESRDLSLALLWCNEGIIPNTAGETEAAPLAPHAGTGSSVQAGLPCSWC